MNQSEADMLREKYPNHIPLQQASEYLGVSPRQLSKLIAEGREPFAAIGANIGTSQKYIRIYTERLIAYLNGSLTGVWEAMKTERKRTGDTAGRLPVHIT